MYETMGWCEAYPFGTFPYAWDVANFVLDGRRLPALPEMLPGFYAVLSESWGPDPKSRLSAPDIVSRLAELLD